MPEKGIKKLQQLPNSLDLAPVYFFLCPKVKNALEGIHMDHNDVKKAWKVVKNIIDGEDWMGAFNS